MVSQFITVGDEMERGGSNVAVDPEGLNCLQGSAIH